jgi:hypothetical protein
MGLLHELVPAAATIAVLLDPTYVNFDTQLKEVQEATGTLGLRIQVLRASTEQDLKASFASLAQLGAQALLVGANPFFSTCTLKSSRWRHVTPFRRSTSTAYLLMPAGWRATGPILPRLIVRPATMRDES